MSEPASLVVQCRIAPGDLGRCLAAREPRASGWPDWAGLEVTLAGHEIADLDLRTGASTGDFLRRMRASAERPADWLCAYDAPDQTLTIGQTLFSDNWLTIVAVLAVLRRLGNFIAPGQAPGTPISVRRTSNSTSPSSPASGCTVRSMNSPSGGV